MSSRYPVTRVTTRRAAAPPVGGAHASARGGRGATMAACATSSTSPTWSATPRWCGSGRSPPGIAATGAGQGRVPQPRRQREGPHRAADDRGRRGVGRAEARRHDRRADLRQHRRRAGDGRPAQGLPVRLRLPGQGQRGQAQRAAGVRRRGRGLPDRGRPGAPRLLLQRLRPAGRARSTAPGSPTSTPTRTTRGRTTRPPARRSGSRPTAGSPTSSRASAPAARSAAPAATSRRSPSGRVAGHRRRPGGLGLLRRHRPALPGRGRRRGLLARRPTTGRLRRDHRGLRRRLVRDDPAAGPRGGAAGRRLVRDGRRSRRCEVAARARRGPRRRGRRAAARRRPRLPRKIFNDEWMAGYGFLPRRRRGATVGDVLRGKAGAMPDAGAHPPERDGRRRRGHPARVRRLADAGRPGRAAGDGRRGRRLGRRSATCSTRCSPAARS